MAINVDIKGLDNLYRALDKRFSERGRINITDNALRSGAEVIKNELKMQFQSFKDTGASIDEITIGQPETDLNGARYIKIYWKGPKGRYRIIHLNEFGTVKNPNPRGKGAIERALRAGTVAYKRAIADGIRRGIQ